MRGEERAAVEALFEAALELAPESRPDFVARACAGDERKLRAVLALLAAHAREEGVLEGSAATLLREAAAPERLGVYRVLREIGRGGMGRVYDAERDDGQFRRRVAIKVLRADGDPDLRERVLTERQILAALDHPNIARLLDGGVTPDGRPYLVMEHVAGLPVDVYCDRMRLGVGERLRLFCVIARAVEYAHHNLVVHRDLKPSNILVAPDGTVKLLDFGVAKLLNPWLSGGSLPVTREGLALTPEYASPEQLRGEALSTGTDVYSLGVVLYELLTGRRPHAAHERSPAHHAHAVLQGDVERPSARVLRAEVVPGAGGELRLEAVAVAKARQTTPERLARALRGDVDAIVGMALRAEPARRYGSAEQLALDIERHFAHRRVHAHEGSRGYAVGKFVRRYRVQTAAGVVVAVALASGVGAALWQAGAAKAERDRAALANAEAQRVTEFLLTLFEAGAPEASAAGTVTAQELVERGVARISALADPPAVQAPLLAALGRVLGSLAEYDEAERLTVRALEIYQSLGDAAGEARLLVQRGSLQREAGRYREAEQTLQQARAIQERVYGEDAAALGPTWLRLAQVASYLGEHDEAQRRADRAWSIQRAALGDLSSETLGALALRGTIQRSRGRLDEAERTLRAVVEQRPQVPGYARHELLDDQLQLADVLLRKADTLAAEELYLEVLTLARRTPEELEARGRVRLRLAAVLSARGDHAGAERLLRELHQERTEVYPAGHRSIAESAMALAGVLARAGDLAGAESHYREAADSYRATVGEQHLAHANALAQISAIWLRRGEHARADSLLAHAVALRIEGEGPLAHGLPDLLRRRAEVAIAARRFPQAESFLDEALRNATTRQYSPGVSREIHAAYAALYTAWNRPDRAAEHRLRAQPPS